MYRKGGIVCDWSLYFEYASDCDMLSVWQHIAILISTVQNRLSKSVSQVGLASIPDLSFHYHRLGYRPVSEQKVT